MKTLITIAIATLLTACGTLKPETVTDAVRAHALFPSLSQAVSECLADKPEVREQVKPYFNALVDTWSEASELEPNEELLIALVNAPLKIADAERNWQNAKALIVGSGVECDSFVKSEVENIETTFKDLKSAIQSSERAVLAIQWTQIIGRIALGRGGQVVRMD